MCAGLSQMQPPKHAEDLKDPMQLGYTGRLAMSMCKIPHPCNDNGRQDEGQGENSNVEIH